MRDIVFFILSSYLFFPSLVLAVDLSRHEIAFIMNDENGKDEIFLVKSDGRDLIQLTNLDIQPANLVWSPDRKWIAFTGYPFDSKSRNHQSLYVINTENGIIKKLYDFPKHSMRGGWTENGKELIWSPMEEKKRSYRFNFLDGSGSFAGTIEDIDFSFYSFSDRFVTYSKFESKDKRDFEIGIYDSYGVMIKRLTDNNYDDIWPAFSPDGKDIVFVSKKEGISQLYIIGSDGKGLKKITDFKKERYLGYLSWAQKIAFVNPENIIRLANSMDHYGGIKLGEELLERKSVFQPAYLYFYLGEIHREMRLLSKAEEYYRKAVLLKADEIKFHITLGEISLVQNKFGIAEESFIKAKRLNPKDHRPYFLLGRLFIKKGDYRKAVTELERASEIEPNSEVIKIELEDAKRQIETTPKIESTVIRRETENVPVSLPKGKLLYSVDFSKFNPKIKDENNKFRTIKVEDGKFFIHRKLKGSTIYNFKGGYEDFILEVDMENVSSESTGYGVIFSKSDSNYFTFLINNITKRYAVFKKMDGNFIDLIKWKDASIITKNSSNRLSIMVNKKEVSFYINNVPVENIIDEDINTGDYGFIVSIGSKVYFQNLAVYSIH